MVKRRKYKHTSDWLGRGTRKKIKINYSNEWRRCVRTHVGSYIDDAIVCHTLSKHRSYIRVDALLTAFDDNFMVNREINHMSIDHHHHHRSDYQLNNDSVGEKVLDRRSFVFIHLVPIYLTIKMMSYAFLPPILMVYMSIRNDHLPSIILILLLQTM